MKNLIREHRYLLLAMAFAGIVALMVLVVMPALVPALDEILSK